MHYSFDNNTISFSVIKDDASLTFHSFDFQSTYRISKDTLYIDKFSTDGINYSSKNFVKNKWYMKRLFIFTNPLAELLDYEVGYFHTGVLDDYSDYRLQVTHWSGFCGPAACAWVYRGKYNNYNGYYLPIFGDGTHARFYEYLSDYYAVYDYYNSQLSNGLSDALDEYNNISGVADNGLAACFYNQTVPFWWGDWQFPLYHGGLNRGFRTATNNQYHVTLTCKPYDWITLNDQPIIIAINCSHYIVAFGYGVTKKKKW